MNKPSDFGYEAALQLESAYEASERFFEPFYIFSYRLGSLQRYFEFSSHYIESYLSRSRESLKKVIEDPASGIEYYFHYDLTSSDESYFAEYLRASVLSHIFTLIEGLLTDVAQDVARSLGQPVELPSKMPYINKYVTYLQRGCGLSLKIDKETWRTLDALRELRNRYVHRLNRDLPAQIQQHLQKLMEAVQQPDMDMNNSFVRAAISTIGKLAAEIEAAYWQFEDKREAKTTLDAPNE